MSEEMSPVSKKGCLSWALGAFLGFALLFLILPLMLGMSIWVLELLYHLVAGWVLHATRALAHFRTDLPQMMRSALLPGMATAVALWGSHRLILWWRLASGKDQVWHFKHTALAGSLVLLGSAAAMALSGIAHEAAWLPQGKIIKSNRRTTATAAINNARQLGFMLFEYETEHGAFPQSLLDLQELAGDSMNLQRMMFVDLDHSGPPEPFIFLKPGGTAAGNSSQVIVIGPQMPEDGKFVALKLDHSATSLTVADFIEVVRSAADADPEGK